eukprot:1146658-Pelagomonas_calceolata.AAC.2
MGWQQSSVCSAARRGEAARVPWDGIQACVQQQMREEGARVPWDGSRAACVQQQGVGRVHVCHGMAAEQHAKGCRLGCAAGQYSVDVQGGAQKYQSSCKA